MHLFILFPYILYISSCSFSSQSQSIQSIPDESITNSNPISTHSYEEISHLKIFWSEIFKQSQKEYYVYLYSETCNHCKSFKDTIIDYALNSDSTIYFVSYSPEIVIDEEKAEQKNVDSLNDLAIKGYPSLLYLNEKIVTLNVAGLTLIKEALKLDKK